MEIRKLTAETAVPIGIAVAITTVFISATWWLRGTLQEIAFEQKVTSDRIGRIENTVQSATTSGVQERDLRLWIIALGRENAGKISVPEWVR